MFESNIQHSFDPIITFNIKLVNHGNQPKVNYCYIACEKPQGRGRRNGKPANIMQYARKNVIKNICSSTSHL